MAGTNAAKLRRPVVHRGASGMVQPPRVVTTVKDAVAFAKTHKRSFTHKLLVKKIAENRAGFPMEDMQKCLDSSVNGNEVEECFLDHPSESEAAGWAQ